MITNKNMHQPRKTGRKVRRKEIKLCANLRVPLTSGWCPPISSLLHMLLTKTLPAIRELSTDQKASVYRLE
jgi:hypothetical protein